MSGFVRKMTFGLVAAAAAAFTAPAKAELVTFSTVGSQFSNGSTTVVLTSGGAQVGSLAFAPITGQINTIEPAPNIVDLGTFQLTTSGLTGSPATVPAGTTFTLFLTQFLPSGGTDSTTASITGSVTATGGGLAVTFAKTLLQIGTVSYQLVNLTGNTLFLDTTTTGGTTRLSADVTANPIPEPASMAMLGMGVLSIAGYSRRRKAVTA